jgi:hypothetical protein
MGRVKGSVTLSLNPEERPILGRCNPMGSNKPRRRPALTSGINMEITIYIGHQNRPKVSTKKTIAWQRKKRLGKDSRSSGAIEVLLLVLKAILLALMALR